MATKLGDFLCCGRSRANPLSTFYFIVRFLIGMLSASFFLLLYYSLFLLLSFVILAIVYIFEFLSKRVWGAAPRKS